VQNNSRNKDLFQRCYKKGAYVKTLAVIFASVFLAELGDKTQMATMLYATEKSARPLHVFIAASAALVVSTLLAVVFGETVTRVVPARTLKTVAGLVFVAVGIWTIVKT
jgi:putative Ca2+/H+ antiporter (TMEM165/GDT1 family)